MTFDEIMRTFYRHVTVKATTGRRTGGTRRAGRAVGSNATRVPEERQDRVVRGGCNVVGVGSRELPGEIGDERAEHGVR